LRGAGDARPLHASRGIDRPPILKGSGISSRRKRRRQVEEKAVAARGNASYLPDAGSDICFNRDVDQAERDDAKHA